MRRASAVAWISLLAAAFTLAACGDGSGPPSSPTQDLVYLEGSRAGPGRLVRVAADGSHRTVLYEAANWISEMYVAPDGRILLSADQWLLIPAGGGTAAPFTPPNNEAAHSPLWAPDGGSIAWLVLEPHGSAIAVAAPNAPTAQVITPDSLDAFSPDWSPDGERLAFVALNNLRGTYNLYSIRRDGSDVRKLTADSLYAAQPPAWSHSGNQIAYNRGDIWVMAADGSAPRQVTTGGAVGEADGFSGTLYWSPDDRAIIATSHRFHQMYRVRLSSGAQTSLNLFTPATNPQSPDASLLLTLGRTQPDSLDNTSGAVFVALADGTNGVQVSPDSVSGGKPAWLPAAD
jgi:dipeptidyl aminopeptidase/acylaminoacyl peptidase